jgi:predicted RNase H-like nuclease (RuvC/YqgF family)
MFYDTKQTFRYYMTILFEKNNLQVTRDNITEWDFIFESMEDDIKEIVEKELENLIKSPWIQDEIKNNLENTIEDIARETTIDEHGEEIENLKNKVKELEDDQEGLEKMIEDLEQEVENG